MSNTRSLDRLIERIEEFLDEYRTMLDADEIVTFDEAISIVDKVKTELEDQDSDRSSDEDIY